MRLASRWLSTALLLGIGLAFVATAGSAQTRRAFVVGIKNYRDPGIQQLSLATQDAEGIASDLKQIGFDEKNVKLMSNPTSKDAFLSEFNKFVETVKEGDVVFFYFSGHGYGGRASDGQPENYLLFGDIRSPLEFARSKATDAERKTPQLLFARAESRETLVDYQTIEVPAKGISEKDILSRLSQKKPRIAIIVLDACRTLLLNQAKGIGRVTGGTTLKMAEDAPQGFMIIYSASQGQQAIEKFGDSDQRQNSLFTSVFRDYLLKPGLDLTHIAKRVQDKVAQIAQAAGHDQDPEFLDRIRNGDFYFIDPIGADRFKLDDNPCDFAAEDMREIRERPRRERLERHLHYFGQCPTAREANQLLEVLAHGVTDKSTAIELAPGRALNPCDRLAASEEDPARPPEVPGVNFAKIDTDAAIAACDKATADSPRVVRYLFNLARAYQRKAQVLPDDDPQKRKLEVNAVIRYDDAVKRGYVAAFNNLALMYDKGQGVDQADPKEATRLLKAGADQGHPIAMYNLAFRYRTGEGGLPRDSTQAYELFAKAAEAGNVGAMARVGLYLAIGYGVDSDSVRAVEWLRRAANAGSDEAKRYLGLLYYFGGRGVSAERRVTADPSQALLWFAQAAEEGDSASQRFLAEMFESGSGLTTQQPQLAERYWRLAAYNGNVDAEVEFADRILAGRVLIRPENGPGEVVKLLQQAMALGSSKAALRLAKLYRTGEFGYAVRPELAVKYAYRAIDLATQTGSGDTARASQFDDPLDEVAAGILLAEMSANGEAVNQAGQPLLTQDERDRLERYYGRPDPETKKVKVRSLKVAMTCGVKYLWLWDWGRDEAPTEMQFRYYESQSPPCIPIMDSVVKDGRRASTRDTLKALWDAVRKDKDKKVSFADIVAAQADAAAAEAQNTQRKR